MYFSEWNPPSYLISVPAEIEVGSGWLFKVLLAMAGGEGDAYNPVMVA